MAKFRRGHGASCGSGLRNGAVIVVLLATLALFLIRRLFPVSRPAQQLSTAINRESEYLPGGNVGQLIHHKYFSLSYLEQFEQAQWVAYELTRAELDGRRVPRTDRFNPDYSVTTRSAYYRDYTGSGYTRGHLAPAADMAFDTLAMRESFYMSNVSPQLRAFNNGIWRELEEQTRDWAREYGRLYIVTGPVLNEALTSRIGQNHVAVPGLFYKVIINPEAPDLPGIAFLIPNALSTRPLTSYAVSIDSVEKITSIDFFYQLDDIREDNIDISRWPMNETRYKLRVKEWNYQ